MRFRTCLSVRKPISPGQRGVLGEALPILPGVQAQSTVKHQQTGWQAEFRQHLKIDLKEQFVHAANPARRSQSISLFSFTIVSGGPPTSG